MTFHYSSIFDDGLASKLTLLLITYGLFWMLIGWPLWGDLALLGIGLALGLGLYIHEQRLPPVAETTPDHLHIFGYRPLRWRYPWGLILPLRVHVRIPWDHITRISIGPIRNKLCTPPVGDMIDPGHLWDGKWSRNYLWIQYHDAANHMGEVYLRNMNDVVNSPALVDELFAMAQITAAQVTHSCTHYAGARFAIDDYGADQRSGLLS